MDRKRLSGVDWTLLIDGFSNNVHNSSKSLRSNWDHDWVADINDLLSSNKSFGGVHSNGSHVVSSQMLGDLKNKSNWESLDLECVLNWWKVSFELYVNDGTNDL
jgi:hypothetical protein